MRALLPRWIPELPLLGKELTEKAARRRTYLLRVLYGVVLFGGFLASSWELFDGQAPLWRLGRGDKLLDDLVDFQFVGILVFLPLLMAGAIAGEKERGSLEVLFLTPLTPRQIVLEKYLSGLIPMLTFLLLSLPLMAIAYSLGGVSEVRLVSSAWLLFLTCLVVGAVVLMMSAYCRTTPGALVASYVLGPLYLLGLGIVLAPFIWFTVASTVGSPIEVSSNEPVLLQWFVRFFVHVALPVFPVLLVVLLSLSLARHHLVHRAQVPPVSPLRSILDFVDQRMEELNRLIGGIVLVRDRDSLPGDEPILWREVERRSLGKFRHRLRIVLVMEIPVVILGTLFTFGSPYRPYSGGGELSSCVFLTWVVAVLALAVTGTNAIGSERTRQTLDLLLTTPLSGREIVLQKYRALARLQRVFWVPLVTLYLLKSYWISTGPESVAYLGFSLASLLLFLPLVSWVSLWIGLRVRHRLRAILTVALVLVAWNGLPFLVPGLFHPDLRWLGIFFSPAAVNFVVERLSPGLHPFVSWLTVAFCVNGGLLLLIRRLCLRRADRYLGRC